MSTPVSRRAEALALAERLLDDIELGNLSPVDAARRTSRLARLLDEVDAIEWSSYEIGGYPIPLDASASAAAHRSNRQAPEGRLWTGSLAALAAEVEAVKSQLDGASGRGSGGEWELAVEAQRREERGALSKRLVQRRELIDRIVGSFHAYAAQRYQELRFGAAIETAFEVVRREVDAAIGQAVSSALPMLAGAMENAVSDNPEHWASAAATCRRLLKEVADVLRPPGPDVELPNGRKVKMGDGNYINRLVDHIRTRTESETAADLAQAELEFLGRRLDATDAAGQKGAHSSVTKSQASRFITGTYLSLGDILRLGTPDAVVETPPVAGTSADAAGLAEPPASETQTQPEPEPELPA